MLARVAASHLRVGTFQYAAASGDPDVLRALADYAIARHYPEAADAPNRYLDLYRRVVAAQASLVARWMLAGFVHGVMNTDNTTISGETIDYGPCAFMDTFDPATVFSSIDDQGRYAYGNQPRILQWNLARLAETLLPLVDDSSEAAVEAATEVLNEFASAYDQHWAEGMAAKLGLAAPDRDLAEDILKLMRVQKVDFTQFFRALAVGTARTLFTEPEPFDAWAARREALLPRTGPRCPPRWTGSTPSMSRAITASRRRWPKRPRASWRRSTSWSTSSPARLTNGPAWRTTPVRPLGRRPVRHLLRHLSMSPTMLTADRAAYSARFAQ